MTYKAFFSPQAANLPVGMSWPLTATSQDIFDSLIALKGDYKSSIPAFQAIEPMLDSWLKIARSSPDLLQIPYVLYRNI
jgi:hypothetical protein